MAELTLRSALEGLPGAAELVVSSAGASAAPAHPVCEQVRDFHPGPAWSELAQRHRSRAIEVDQLEEASIVLTASRGIRASVVSAVPARRRRVFTLLEAVWLGADHEPASDGSLPDAVEAFREHIDANRGLRPLPAAGRRLALRPRDPLDIDDGHVMRPGRHLETIRTVDRVARRLAELIAGPTVLAR